MAIITLAQAKAAVNIAADNTADDAELQGYVDAITGAVEDYKGCVIEQRQVTERLTLPGASTFLLNNVPVISLDAVASVDGTQTWDVTQLDADPDTGRVIVLAGAAPAGLVLVAYTAGYADGAVPPRYVQGALVILEHVWETQRGTMGPATGVIGGEETYDPRQSYSIPRKALEWLGPPLAGIA